MKLINYIVLFTLVVNFYFLLHADYLDTTFGLNKNGIVTTDIEASSNVSSIAIDSNGKILAVGTSIQNKVNKFALARYSSTGTLDTSFGTSGIVLTSIGTGAKAQCCKLTSDSKILVGGLTIENGLSKFAIVKYNSDGSLDTSFGTGGKVITLIGDGCAINSIGLTSDNKIIAAGFAGIDGKTYFATAKYNADGSIDSSFGNSGSTTVDVDYHNYGFAVAIDSNNKIVVVGYSSDGTIQFSTLLRLNIDGSLDSTFGSGGSVKTQINSYSKLNAVAIQSDGKIVVVGDTNLNSLSQIAVARYNIDGSLDTNFGVDQTGIIKITIDSYDKAESVLIQPDGKILVTGSSKDDLNMEVVLLRLNSDGSFDTTFGTQGKIVTSVNYGMCFNSLALQTDGKIITGGTSCLDAIENQFFTLGRYLKNNVDYISITSPVSGSTIETKKPVVSGTSSAVSAQVEVLINGALFTTVNTDESGNWTTNEISSLSRGSNSIQANLKVNSEIIATYVSKFTVDTMELTSSDYVFASRTTYLDGFSGWADIGFDNILSLSGWTYNPSNCSFLCANSGKYLISYTGTLTCTLSNTTKVSTIRGILNGVEIQGGTAALAVDNQKSNYITLSRSFVKDISAGNSLKFQLNGIYTRLIPIGIGLSQSFSFSIVRIA
jgi:uncharacterized delta-60 repeat protein